MNRRTEKLFYDCLQYSEDILRLTKGRGVRDLADDMALRYAINHALTVVGEALSIIRRDDPGALKELPESADVVGLRNRIVHAYDHIKQEVIWATIQKDIPLLIKRLKTILQ